MARGRNWPGNPALRVKTTKENKTRRARDFRSLSEGFHIEPTPAPATTLTFNFSNNEQMKKPVATLLSVTLALSGCATSSKDVVTSYISPLQYQSFDCDQLAAENQRLQGRVNQLAGRLDEAASNDKTIGVVGAILFWPALFALGGTKGQEAEYARLKGEAEAIQQAAILKKCPGVVATPKP